MIEDAVVSFPHRMREQASGVFVLFFIIFKKFVSNLDLAGGGTADLTQAYEVDAEEGLSAAEAGVVIAERLLENMNISIRLTWTVLVTTL